LGACKFFSKYSLIGSQNQNNVQHAEPPAFSVTRTSF
jgi:hypothetical protein